jgi:putative transcriptional regulator
VTPHGELSSLLFGGSEEEIGRARAHLSGCEACRRAYQQVTEGLAAPTQKNAAAGGVSERLLELARASRRMLVFADRVAKMFGIDPPEAEALLNRAYEAHHWKPFLGPGVSVLPVAGRGEWAPHQCGLLKLEPGTPFPEHPHAFGEHVLVLQGGFREDSGDELWRGETAFNGPGTRHALRALQGEACVAAVVTLQSAP